MQPKVIDKDAVMENGGLITDGTTMDPVSGNEVPPGSSANDVRDDIPARLSENEYVVPADVLRFYGVAFFEKLRKKAKEGLSAMDSEGRIGGDVEEEDDDDFPFDPEELEAEDELEMAEGGVVPPTPGGKPPAFNPGAYSFGGQQFTPPGATPAAGGTEVRNYINAAGDRRSVLFVAGQPATPIPEGFVPDTEEGRKSLPSQNTGENTPNTKIENAGEGRDTATTPEGSAQKDIDPKDNYYGLSAEALGDVGDKGKFSGKTGAGIGGMLAGPAGAVVGGVAGAAAELSGLADARARAEVARDRAKEDPSFQATADKLDGIAKGLEDGLSSAARGAKSIAEALGLDVATGKNIAESHKGSFGKASASKTPSTGATGSVSKASASPSGGGASAGGSRGGDDRSAGGFGVDARAKGGLMVKKKPAATKKKIKVVDK